MPRKPLAKVGREPSAVGDSLRDKRIEAHLWMVRRIARALFWTKRAAGTDLADLCAYGAEGLIEAADRFDEARGVPFQAFARRRIAGAILDGLRRERDWFGRGAQGQVTLLRFDHRQASTADNLLGAVADRGDVVEGGWNGRRMCQPSVYGGLEDLAGALDALSNDERQVIELHYYEGRSLSDAGREMEIGRSWASRLHARARAAIRAQLGRGPGR